MLRLIVGCNVSDAMIDLISQQYKGLTKLSLSENLITDDSLALIGSESFPHLSSLVLRRCSNLSSTGISNMIESLGTGNSLQSLDLWGTSLDDQVADKIAQSLPNLNTLLIGETLISDAGLTSLAGTLCFGNA